MIDRWINRIKSVYGQPLCGWGWFKRHRNDYTAEDIASLSIQVSCAGVSYPSMRQNGKRGLVKELVHANR